MSFLMSSRMLMWSGSSGFVVLDCFVTDDSADEGLLFFFSKLLNLAAANATVNPGFFDLESVRLAWLLLGWLFSVFFFADDFADEGL